MNTTIGNISHVIGSQNRNTLASNLIGTGCQTGFCSRYMNVLVRIL